ncbi:Hypothetical protein SMAX5B_007713 [Scophthalmus maximus]|uniref:Uncharacterized protein n=1 Tax=Scophthalmus maximus TaxID=52904 RepID=A0A2U9BLF3_SCOMX|nr:Hypothetical protein SMAX5B_007713 [Scophthalmus maximus]KAF0047375.1 hypothetical protein F2P81_001008 [Scophthalmus maximus]
MSNASHGYSHGDRQQQPTDGLRSVEQMCCRLTCDCSNRHDSNNENLPLKGAQSFRSEGGNNRVRSHSIFVGE